MVEQSLDPAAGKADLFPQDHTGTAQFDFKRGLCDSEKGPN
jgi:hypothetical protein